MHCTVIVLIKLLNTHVHACMCSHNVLVLSVAQPTAYQFCFTNETFISVIFRTMVVLIAKVNNLGHIQQIIGLCWHHASRKQDSRLARKRHTTESNCNKSAVDRIELIEQMANEQFQISVTLKELLIRKCNVSNTCERNDIANVVRHRQLCIL